MNNILFIAPVDLLDDASGVTQKVKNQYMFFVRNMNESYLAAFEDYDVVIYRGEECIYRNGNRSKRRLARLLDIANFIVDKRINYIYIRYMLALPHLILLLRKVRKVVDKIAIEVPDYPYKYKLLKRNEYVLYLIDSLFSCNLKSYIDRVFVCSNDKMVLGIKSTQLFNGTNINDYNLRSITNNSEAINVLSISTMGVGTAVDRFLKGLAIYNKLKFKKTIILHLVGDGISFPYYKRIIAEEKLENNVKVYGYMHGTDSTKVFNYCDIGLGVLGCHRVGIKNDSTLKSREYGLRGMPIIAENKIDILDNDYKYVMYCPYDDSPVDMNKVVEFYDECFKRGKEIAANEIRNYFIERCDINKTMLPVLSFFIGDK